ncbi:MAG: Crp/Fnr family transcriptional regulator [Alphaproteobacteria bacterium]|nr:Crp/Fnr family transcriptional regulator [Alphaproteobacteria bacterium]
MADSLAHIELLSGLPGPELEALAKRCSWRRFQTDQQVLAHLDAGTDVLFLVEGRLRVSLYSPSGKEVSFEDIQAGQAFGELAAIDAKGRSASVFALEPCYVAFLDANGFMELLRAHFTVARRVMITLCRMVRRLDERVFEFSTLTVSNRIQAELLRLAGGDAGKQSAVISPVPRHADIASRVSTHREAVTREMNVLARAGVLRQDRDALHILDLPKLAQMVHEVLGLEPPVTG